MRATNRLILFSKVPSWDHCHFLRHRVATWTEVQAWWTLARKILKRCHCHRLQNGLRSEPELLQICTEMKASKYLTNCSARSDWKPAAGKRISSRACSSSASQKAPSSGHRWSTVCPWRCHLYSPHIRPPERETFRYVLPCTLWHSMHKTMASKRGFRSALSQNSISTPVLRTPSGRRGWQSSALAHNGSFTKLLTPAGSP